MGKAQKRKGEKRVRKWKGKLEPKSEGGNLSAKVRGKLHPISTTNCAVGTEATGVMNNKNRNSLSDIPVMSE